MSGGAVFFRGAKNWVREGNIWMHKVKGDKILVHKVDGGGKIWAHKVTSKPLLVCARGVIPVILSGYSVLGTKNRQSYDHFVKTWKYLLILESCHTFLPLELCIQ